MAPRSKRSEPSADATTSATSDDGTGAFAGRAKKGTGSRSIDPTDAAAGEIGGPDAAAGTGPGVDALLADLERIVQELEHGELPLEAALARFETGIRLARRGGAMLDALEQRVDVLLGGRIEPADLDLYDADETAPADDADD